MNDIRLKVTANRLEILEDTYTTGGSVNFDGCIFTFDATWNGFEKTAVFALDTTDHYRVSLEGNTCRIPAACISKEGLLKIGMYGINADGVVITTNLVVHRVNEGVGEVENWIEEDNSIIYNALRELESSYEEYIGSLDTRFNNLLRMVQKNGGLSGSQSGLGEPDDWYKPKAFADAQNLPSYIKGSAYEDYFDYILNKLTVDFPDFVTCCSVGTDSDGVYPIYSYNFEPLNYEKTLLVYASVSSTDGAPFLALSNFLDELCRNYENDRTLSYLRSKVKLVVIPCVNPYGLVNGTDCNSNSVNINRNFAYRWSDCKDSSKGVFACDQRETFIATSLAETYAEDKLCAALSVDTDMNLYSSKTVFYPRFRKNCISAIAEVLNRYNYEEKNEADVMRQGILAPSINPTLTNYLADGYSINTCAIRWSSVNYGGAYSNTGITKLTELIGNMVYALAENSTYTLQAPSVPFTKHFSWRSTAENDVFAITSVSELAKIPITSVELPIKSPCNITLNGYAIIRADSACTVKLNPVLWQEMSPEQTYAERLAMSDFVLEIPLSAGTYVFPLNSVLQAYYSDTNSMITSSYPADVMFSLTASTSDSAAANLIGFSVTLNAFPADSARPLEISSPMGMAVDYTAANDIPTQTLVYPLEKVTTADKNYND